MPRPIAVALREDLEAQFDRGDEGAKLIAVVLDGEPLEDFGATRFGEPLTAALEAAKELVDCFLESGVPCKAHPLDATSRWSFTSGDGDALLGRNGSNWPKFREAHTLVRGGGTPQNKESYLLVHHKHKGGRLTTFWAGVQAARQRLRSVKGVSTLEKRAGARHLIGHYREFGKEPPRSLVEMAGTSYAGGNVALATMRLRLMAGRLPT